MATMAMAAVTFASLVYSNQWLGDVFYTLYIAAMFAACIAAIVGQGESRAYWLGFAAAAAAYGGLTILGRSGETSNFYRYIQYGEIAGYHGELVTTRAFTYSYDFIAAQGGGGHDFQDKAEFERFMPYLFIGHSAFGVLAGCAAGAWTRRMYWKGIPQSPGR
jgi:hypothetical protein